MSDFLINPFLVQSSLFGVRDTVFTTNAGTGTDFEIYSLSSQSDGKIILGGYFTTWDGVTVNNIVRLNSNGTRDTAFTANTGTGGTGSAVQTSAVQSDGKIILGGFFTVWNGTTVNRIVRLNSDGTRDTAFSSNTGTGANSGVNGIAIQSDGKIILGGGFSTWNGATVRSVVRLNSDGTRDTAFSTNINTGANSVVNTVAIQSDGKIIVGGAFTTWNGTTVNRIVRLNSDGTRDTTFTTNTGTGANQNVNTIFIQSDGKSLIGGGFSSWNGTFVPYIVRLNSDGTRDTTFTTNMGSGPSSSVNYIAIQSNSKIIVGGGFTLWNGATVGRIVCLNSDGTRDTTFTTNTGTGASGNVFAIAIQSDNNIIVGGTFSTWDGVTVNNIVRLFGT